MKNIFKTSALIMGLMLAVSGGAISANAACLPTQNIQALCGNGCQSLCSVDVNSLIEKCGSSSPDIQAVINKGNCNANDIQCLINNGTCSAEDIQALVEKCGILPDNTQCINCPTEDNVSVPIQNEQPVSVPEVTPSVPVQDNNSNNITGVSAYEQKVVELVNEVRVQNGLSPLTLDPQLSEVARKKSQDMKDKNYFSHTSPTYGSPFDMMKQFGISYKTAGENIAMGQQTPETVMNAWMNSEGHRANILNGSFTQIGVGYVADGNYWTQMFIG